MRYGCLYLFIAFVLLAILSYVAVCTYGNYRVHLDEDETSDVPLHDRWVRFDDPPTICDGVLTVRGTVRNGAALLGPEADTTTFVIYPSGYKAGALIQEPILGFLEPPGQGEYYTGLDETDQVATRLSASPNNPTFELVSDFPRHLDPKGVVLAIWGYRTPGTIEVLVEIKPRLC